MAQRILGGELSLVAFFRCGCSDGERASDWGRGLDRLVKGVAFDVRKNA